MKTIYKVFEGSNPEELTKNVNANVGDRHRANIGGVAVGNNGQLYQAMWVEQAEVTGDN